MNVQTNDMASWMRQWYGAGIYVLILGVSLSVNVALWHKVRNASKNSIVTRADKGCGGSVNETHVGMRLPTMRLTDLDGRPVSAGIVNRDRMSIIYVVSEDCLFCQHNRNGISELYRQLNREYHIVAIARMARDANALRSMLAPGCPVYLSRDIDRITRGTPHTFEVSPDGTVKKEWSGAYIGSVRNEIESHYGINLPADDGGPS